mmetsp:Transcript_3502/g.13584  ORF Transcript_3502/g.13584 Transcript_3502/m.13584 type:complete len:498 (+) Transcript_3502:359-1852(+)
MRVTVFHQTARLRATFAAIVRRSGGVPLRRLFQDSKDPRLGDDGDEPDDLAAVLLLLRRGGRRVGRDVLEQERAAFFVVGVRDSSRQSLLGASSSVCFTGRLVALRRRRRHPAQHEDVGVAARGVLGAVVGVPAAHDRRVRDSQIEEAHRRRRARSRREPEERDARRDEREPPEAHDALDDGECLPGRPGRHRRRGDDGEGDHGREPEPTTPRRRRGRRRRHHGCRDADAVDAQDDDAPAETIWFFFFFCVVVVVEQQKPVADRDRRSVVDSRRHGEPSLDDQDVAAPREKAHVDFVLVGRRGEFFGPRAPPQHRRRRDEPAALGQDAQPPLGEGARRAVRGVRRARREHGEREERRVKRQRRGHDDDQAARRHAARAPRVPAVRRAGRLGREARRERRRQRVVRAAFAVLNGDVVDVVVVGDDRRRQAERSSVAAPVGRRHNPTREVVAARGRRGAGRHRGDQRVRWRAKGGPPARLVMSCSAADVIGRSAGFVVY